MEVPKLRSKEYLKLVLDTIPVAVVLVNQDLFVIDSNKAALDFILLNKDATPPMLCGDAMNCVNAKNSKGGCGTTEYCKDCVIRNSVLETFSGDPVVRRYGVITQDRDGELRELHLMVSVTPVELGGSKSALVTLEDVTELYELRQIIPICSSCKKVRTDQGYWEKVDSYLQKHAGMKFSHGICPDCKKELYSDLK